MPARASLVTALLSLLLVVPVGLIAAPVSAFADDEMGERRAGRVFLKATCPHNEVTLRFQNRAIEPFNALSTYSQARKRLPAFKREAGRLATATYRWARALLNPPANWPSSVSGQIDKAVNRGLRAQRALRSASAASSVRGWRDHVVRASKAWRSVPNATIRARLDLPAPGRGC